MKKHIRPLSAWKRLYPKAFEIASQFLSGKSKKDRENSFYRLYTLWYSKIPLLVDGNAINPFYFAGANQEVNSAIRTEIGRLLLTGWYYDIEGFCVDICQYVYKSYLKKSNEFNELEYSKKLKEIRNNIEYYYHHPDELKFFILESFFAAELKPLLPEPPQRLKFINDCIEMRLTYKRKKEKEDKDYFYKKSDMQELYIQYLEDTLTMNCLPFQSYEDFESRQKEECEEFAQEYAEMHRQYQGLIKGKTLENIKLLMLA